MQSNMSNWRIKKKYSIHFLGNSDVLKINYMRHFLSLKTFYHKKKLSMSFETDAHFFLSGLSALGSILSCLRSCYHGNTGETFIFSVFFSDLVKNLLLSTFPAGSRLSDEGPACPPSWCISSSPAGRTPPPARPPSSGWSAWRCLSGRWTLN